MNFDYGEVVVGAGPVGSTISYYLAQGGLNVAIIERKKQIGYLLFKKVTNILDLGEF